MCDSKHTKSIRILLISKCIPLSNWAQGRGRKACPGLQPPQDALPSFASFAKYTAGRFEYLKIMIVTNGPDSVSPVLYFLSAFEK